MEVFGGQQLGAALLDSLFPCRPLAFGAVTVAAGNGEISITCVMGSIF
jgi:hypothetical protein